MVSPPGVEPANASTVNPGKGFIPQVLKAAHLVFWDFDGVVKDSIEVKTEGFRWIVRSAGTPVCDRVQRHHESNGGMSRFDKIPLYLTWADMPASAEPVHKACVEFSEHVTDAVVNSPWVEGVPEYLRNNPGDQLFILVTSTPLEEITRILDQLDLLPCFSNVFGSPSAKVDAVASSLANRQIAPDRAVFIGDSMTDYEAASSNHVPFLLRRHSLNKDLAASLTVPSLDNLIRY